MTRTIELITHINAPLQVCYDLSRSIDLHTASMSDHEERAIAGRTQGLIERGETVTWAAKHFLIDIQMTVRITDTLPPFFFCDEMVKGPFARMKHTHVFQKMNDVTVMRDYFEYALPLGVVGKLIDKLWVGEYLKSLLTRRNTFIKKTAEDKFAARFLKDEFAA